MASTFAGGALRVTTPASYDAKPASRRRSKGLPGDTTAASKDALVAALKDSGLDPVERVDLTPRKTKDLKGPAVSNRVAKVRFEVDVPPEEDAVVLLERDGVYSWHLPKNPIRRTRSLEQKSLEKKPRTARFEIDVQPRPTPAKRKPAGPKEDRTRGLLGDLVQGAAQAIVFRFVAPAILEKAIAKMEEHVHPGLIHIAKAEVGKWRPFDNLDELNLPTDRPVRVLLFIHGTFSSTVGGFGALGVDKNGKGFLRTCIGAYDAVFGFDHKTLSVDPRQNAENLLKRLKTHRPGAQFVIDIVTHSRGGLVTRSFVEQVLPESDWPGKVDNIVFVAATNAGTHLADPKRWGDLVDLYTNLASVTAGGLALVPGAAPVTAVVNGVVQGIGAFVKYLVSYAAEGGDVPGLKAMVPGGAFVKEINKTQPGQPGPGTNWFVVSSNFHVELFDDHHNPPEFPRELVRKLNEGFVDRLFKGPNDLVVDDSSMGAIDTAVGGFVRDRLDLGKNDTVYHTNYFNQLCVVTKLGGWLPLGMGAGGGEEQPKMAMAEPPAPEPVREVRARGGGYARAECSPQRAKAMRRAAPRPAKPRPMGTAARMAPPPEARMAEPPPADEELTEASLAAEMPGHVVAKEEFVVRVRLSRNAIVATEGAVHAEAEVQVDESRPVSVQVIGKRNVEVLGSANDVFELPVGGGSSELPFRAKALAAGPCVVSIVVRQGTVQVATMSLDATAVGKTGVATMPSGTTSEATTHPGIDAPELEGVPCLDIFERELTNNRVSYQYALRLEPGKPVLMFESKPIKDREKTIGKILDDVTKVWKNTEAEPRERERKLQDIGAEMFDELFPEDMQTYLWRKRAKVRDLIVYADEPFVPWELVHLKPPNGPRQNPPRFLAQSGMVRWQPGSFPPKEMRVREGRARSLVPAYKDPVFALTEPVLEQEFLAEKFKATKVTATPTGVRKLLRSGQFDLLHFSGHGAADPHDILDAKVLLQGLKRAGTVEPQYLGATTVSENARLTKEDEIGPLVVLNACQVGRAGELLTTVGGFAKAFLDAGASAFVSCLWSVAQEPSRVFVEKLYEELLKGTPMALASARSREATRNAGDASWLAFVVYARPDAVLVRT